MTMHLKQSTAITVVLGPFVDSADGNTVEGSLTISQADVRLSKNGGAFAQVNESTSAAHMENGYYSKDLNTTDTNTLGRLFIAVHESGALPVWQTYMVLPANVWDSLYGADKLEVDVAQFGGTNLTASGGRPEVNTTHAAGTAWGSGAITNAAFAADAITAAKLHADVTTELQSGLATAAALATVDGIVDDILLDTAEIGAAGAGLTNINLPNQTMDIIGNITGNLSGSVGSVTGAVGSVTAGVTLGADAVNAAALAADAIAEINTTVDTALADIHLDHLLAVTYDPASKPGAADALLNELVESDAGVARFSANTLEEAPTGGSAPTAGEVADEVQTRTIAAVTTVGSVTGAVGSVTGNVGGDVVGSVGSVTAPVTAGTVSDKTGYSLSAGGIQAIWDALTAALTTVGSIGKYLVDRVADIQSRIPAALTGAGNIKSDALALNGSTTAAANLARSATAIELGAAIAGTLSTTAMSTDLTEATNDHYNGRVIIWTSGVLAKQATDITDYDGTTKVLTFTAVTDAPSAADQFVLV